jgi:hypothetical protein
MVNASDLIIAGGHHLKQEAMRYVAGDKVHVIPTVVDIERYTPKQDVSHKTDVMLGWIGSQRTLQYLKALMPVFEELGRRLPAVQLKIVCNAFLDVPTMLVIKKDWSEADEVADLQGFDIGLGPLPDDVWTRGKCGFKLIQCLAVGVPVVCSPVGANKEIVRDGEEGFWARDNNECVDRLSVLIRDRQLRKRMGEQGRKRIEKDYSLQAMAPQLAKVPIDI